jgi:putative transposase
MQNIRLVERPVIEKNHQYWAEIDHLSFKAKNLYNLVNYYCRQRFFVGAKAWRLNDLYHKSKESKADKALPTKVRKQFVKRVVKCWTSSFAAITEDRKSPEKFLCESKTLGCKDKTDGGYLLPDPGTESIRLNLSAAPYTNL